MPVAGSNASTRACSVRIRLGDNRAMSTLPARRQSPSNQLSNTVLPLPRGPISATSWGGDLPPAKSARQRIMTACSGSRPVSAGGAAPVPGWNNRSCGSLTAFKLPRSAGAGYTVSTSRELPGSDRSPPSG